MAERLEGLTKDEIDVALQGLNMLHSYYVADESSAEELMDDQLETETKVRNTTDVDLTGTPDFDAASEVLERSKSFMGTIEDAMRKLKVWQAAQPDDYDGRQVVVRIDIEQARTLAGFGDCCCELTPGSVQGTCIWCQAMDALYKYTGEKHYNRKDDDTSDAK